MRDAPTSGSPLGAGARTPPRLYLASHSPGRPAPSPPGSSPVPSGRGVGCSRSPSGSGSRAGGDRGRGRGTGGGACLGAGPSLGACLGRWGWRPRGAWGRRFGKRVLKGESAHAAHRLPTRPRCAERLRGRTPAPPPRRSPFGERVPRSLRCWGGAIPHFAETSPGKRRSLSRCCPRPGRREGEPRWARALSPAVLPPPRPGAQPGWVDLSQTTENRGSKQEEAARLLPPPRTEFPDRSGQGPLLRCVARPLKFEP